MPGSRCEYSHRESAVRLRDGRAAPQRILPGSVATPGHGDFA